jgi:hypothetical protein
MRRLYRMKNFLARLFPSTSDEGIKLGEKTPPLSHALFWLLGLGGILLLTLLISTGGRSVLLDWWRPASSSAAVVTVQVDMQFVQYNQMLEQREQALLEGVVLSQNVDFLPATMREGSQAVSVDLRLMTGPAVDLGPDDKWPFEVHVDDESTLFGLRHFYLQNPDRVGGERYTALTQVFQAEGVLAARTRLVRLIFNGDDRGLYVLQEGLTQQLLAEQGYPRGAMVGFDDDLFWQQIAHFGGDIEAALADPVLDLRSSRYLEVETLAEADGDDDPWLDAQRSEALSGLYALQAKARPAGEVLDVNQYARLLALSDLWGFPALASPRNLGFYYAPARGRLEPVAFASNLSGEARISLAETYGDPRVQIAYAREAARVSEPAYLEGLQTTVGDAVDAELWSWLAGRQQLIQRSLDPVQPVFAYLADATPDLHGQLHIGVANVTHLPVELLGFDVGALTFVEIDPAWQQDGQAERVDEGTEGVVLRALDADAGVRYVHFDVPLSRVTAQDAELDPHGQFDLFVATRIAGVDLGYRLTPAQQGVPSLLKSKK